MKKRKTAYEAALHLITYRAQSEWEVRTKLAAKGYEEEEIEETVFRLTESRYIDDEALAEELFSSYRSDGLCGDRYIRQKLKARGLTAPLHLTDEEEEEKARKALEKKLALVPSLASDRRKAAGFLTRRGFSGNAVARALESLSGESE